MHCFGCRLSVCSAEGVMEGAWGKFGGSVPEILKY